MNATPFDPVDLAALSAGYVLAPRIAVPFTLDAAELLTACARMLSRLWMESDAALPGVWAYEVAEPLGAEVAALTFAAGGEMPALAEVEKCARALIRRASGAPCAPAYVVEDARRTWSYQTETRGRAEEVARRMGDVFPASAPYTVRALEG